MLNLVLRQLPDTTLGIYGPDKNTMPASMRRLHPLAAESFQNLAGVLRISDAFRTPESSLHAMQIKRGVQPPGFSAHNFGFAIDVALGDCLKRLGMTKTKFDEAMAEYGWFCHRRDHNRGMEDWHYNHGIEAFIDPKDTSTAPAVERLIQQTYGEQLRLSALEAQTLLKQMRYYQGDLDGEIGPRTEAAIGAFQKAWQVKESGLGRKTQRVLAVVAAGVTLV